MAEIATIARPYADALFKVAGGADLAAEVQALGAVAADPLLRQFAANPKVSAAQVFNVVSDVLGRQGVVLSAAGQNFLREVVANDKVAALPEIAAQYRTLLNTKSGVSDALIESAFPLDDAQLADTVGTLERRFARKLQPRVVVRRELIGGIRVTVGDEVFDASVAARLQHMKIALTA
jgi:F-type H+-transporting ATPase subunit delta